MRIGIPKEVRRCESRVSLVPQDVGKLVAAGHTVCVKRGAGGPAGFPDGAYEAVGARTCTSLLDCDLVVGVKAPALERLKRGVTVMAYLHVEKGQNAELLRRLKECAVLGYAFEEIRDDDGRRLINLGFEAGIVGIVEGLRVLGGALEKAGRSTPLTRLAPVVRYGSRAKVYVAAAALAPVNGINVVIMGKGRVSLGVQDVLGRMGICPTVLCRRDTAHIETFLVDVDILVNAVDWYPSEPHIVTRGALELLKPTAVILDISCDTHGAVETCVPTTWDDPVYEVDGIVHFCVGNLPSAIPADSSTQLSRMILPHVMAVAAGEDLKTGLMTRNGNYVYRGSYVARSVSSSLWHTHGIPVAGTDPEPLCS